VTGPAGSGKSALATQFIATGLAAGEPAVIAVFEEHPKEFLAHAKSKGPDLQAMADKGLLEVIYLRPLDLSVDEALLEIQAAVVRTKAQRLVIDSLSGFELALAPTFRVDFRESLYRMVGALTGSGVTVFMTVEVAESFTDLRFSTDLISFLTDDVIFQRYVEIEGRMHKVMTVIKMRGSAHSKDLRLYDVTERGLEIGNTLYNYHGIVTGVAQRHDVAGSDGHQPGGSSPPAIA
jgi:circadian clock protein KaiC